MMQQNSPWNVAVTEPKRFEITTIMQFQRSQKEISVK